ncbi:MAG: Unknown protein [uncultured Sulfurovum sp.]|uniref:Periplasmic protein n=1 Tax=uncultured Sulfurovum sp. TaxID=269237 RepID=A0A6S6SA34_9BACT|nr:MAG: Unknown protein [uncultured Sulfurovum sp.]
MKQLLSLVLLSIISYAGSADAIINCQSGSARTQLKFSDEDLNAWFKNGEFSIDKKSIKLDDEYGYIISDLKKGVYVLKYNNPKRDIVLDFYAVPSTVKKTKLDTHGTSYKFNAIVGGGSTDPREKNKDLLRKTIWLSCTLKYEF